MSHSPRLLTLPGEIRNMIYEIALTAVEGIQCVGWVYNRPVFCAAGPSSRPRVELNQIKFVSRQLYKETAALEGRFNVVHFVRDPYLLQRPSGERALRFLMSMTPARVRILNTIVINEACVDDESLEQHDPREFMRDTGKTLAALDRLCIEYPSLTLHYIVPNWRGPSIRGERFFLMGIKYSFALRRRFLGKLFSRDMIARVFHELLERGSTESSGVMREAARWISDNHVDLRAANFRFWSSAEVARTRSEMPLESMTFLLGHINLAVARNALQEWGREGL